MTLSSKNLANMDNRDLINDLIGKRSTWSYLLCLVPRLLLGALRLHPHTAHPRLTIKGYQGSFDGAIKRSRSKNRASKILIPVAGVSTAGIIYVTTPWCACYSPSVLHFSAFIMDSEFQGSFRSVKCGMNSHPMKVSSCILLMMSLTTSPPYSAIMETASECSIPTVLLPLISSSSSPA